MKKQLILFTALLFSVAALAQNNPNKAKAWMVNNITTVNVGSINSNNIEFTITQKGDKFIVTARGIRSEGVKGCTNCNVSGKIIFKGDTEVPFKRGTKIVFPPNAVNGQTEKIGTLNPDGSFSFTGVPKGKCDLWVDDVKIATGWKVGGE